MWPEFGWLAGESVRLGELRLHALEGRMSARLDAGGGAELVPDLEQLVAGIRYGNACAAN